ncbi:MAG: response regulator [Microvirga sp.]|nr:response regulator [Microvirga sp.]
MSSDKTLRILVVEDEILIALELESLLQDLGHDVVGIAASSKDALSLGRDLKPDLAFVDIHLSDGPTGIDVARHLSSEHGVTVLFMTANAKRIPEDFAGAWGVEALTYVMAGQPREPQEARTVTFVPFGRGARERSSQMS